MLKELFENCAYNITYQNINHWVSYAFVEEGKTLYVYFQGSHELKDWVANFLFTERVYKMFRVHKGFYTAYSEARSLLLNKIYERDEKANFKWLKIVIVGYSHGGALCQLFLEDCVFHRPDIKSSILGYAFETPRCLKVPAKYRHLWENLTIIRNGRDVITHLPPAIFGYNHLGTMVKIKGDTKLVDNKLPKMIKYHYAQCVLDGLEKLGDKNKE